MEGMNRNNAQKGGNTNDNAEYNMDDVDNFHRKQCRLPARPELREI